MRMAWFSVAWMDAKGKMQSTIVPGYSKEDAQVRFRRVEQDYKEIVGVTLPGTAEHVAMYAGA